MHRFDVSISAVEDLVWLLYGLRADPKTPTRELQSYADRNFLITLNDHLPLLPDNARPNHVSTTDKIVAKLLCEDSSCEAAVEAQNAAICHLISDGIPGARLISSKSGRDMEEVQLMGGRGEDDSALAAPTTRHILRCFEFVHGAPVGILTKVPPSLYTSWGRTMGAASRSLSRFYHPSLSGLRLDWGYDTAGEVVGNKLALIRDEITEQQRHLLVLLLDQWSDPRTAELLGGLRRQPCHGDANEMNVLADGEHVCALLDFGDLSETYAVAEAAISLTYAMLLEMGQCHNGRAAGAPVVGDGAKDGRLEAAFRAGRALLDGYQGASPLDEDEMGVLTLLVRMRLSLSLTTGLAAAVADPSNAEYLLMTQKHGWDLLSALVDQDLIVCLGYAGRAHQVADPGGG